MKRKIDIFPTIIIFAAIIILISPILYIFINNSTIKEVYDAEKFLSGEYRSYHVGDKAGEFFDRFVDAEDYTNISFIYHDYDGRISLLHEYYTTFVLDIQYEEDKYSKIKEAILPLTDDPDAELGYNYIGNFLITHVALDEEVYNNNYCGIFFDDDYHTIRYVFMHKIGRDSHFPEDIIGWNVSLDWNQSEYALVFPE